MQNKKILYINKFVPSFILIWFWFLEEIHIKRECVKLIWFYGLADCDVRFYWVIWCRKNTFFDEEERNKQTKTLTGCQIVNSVYYVVASSKYTCESEIHMNWVVIIYYFLEI